MPIAQIDGQGIYYQDSGGDGPAVVFMHGFLMDREMFDPQVKALAGEYRCVRFDARGLGSTEWDGQPFSLYDIAADCIGLMDHLGINKAAIVGMSQGGYAALRLALRYPDRVTALVLMGTRATVDPEDVKAGYREVRDTWRNVGPVPPLVEGLMTGIVGPQATAGNLWATWRPKMETRTGEQIYHGMNNLLDRDEISAAQLAQITVPTLVIHGEEDGGVPIEQAEAMAEALPNLKGFVRVANAGHSINLTHPEAVSPPLKAFLDEYAKRDN